MASTKRKELHEFISINVISFLHFAKETIALLHKVNFHFSSNHKMIFIELFLFGEKIN
jgi:hypothetical protein